MSGLYTALVSGLVFPLHERLKSHTSVAVRKSLEISQWWGPEQLRHHQLGRLQALVARAYAQVPYYRRVMDQVGVKPRDIVNLESIERLPLLTKAKIRSNSEQLKARDARELIRFNTGGSSGEPLVFYVGKERVSHDVAAKWRATRWWDVDIGDSEIVVWGSPVELSAQDRVRVWRDYLLRTRLIPAFEMSPENLDHFVRVIRRVAPRMLFGYPSSLSLIARHARKQGQPLDDLGISVVFVTSERLYEDQRIAIEDAFAAPVANGYGGRDAGFIAHQCPSGSLHLTAEDILVEIVDPQGAVLPIGEMGEIVVTHFATGDFPFIRYRTGDVGSLGERPCDCGRGLPVLQDLQGRSTDFVVARDGTVMHGLAVIYVVRDLDGIDRFKIVQESLDHTRVLLEPGPGYDPSLNAIITAGIKARLGPEVRVDVEVMERIPADPSGKFRFVVSKVVG